MSNKKKPKRKLKLPKKRLQELLLQMLTTIIAELIVGVSLILFQKYLG